MNDLVSPFDRKPPPRKGGTRSSIPRTVTRREISAPVFNPFSSQDSLIRVGELMPAYLVGRMVSVDGVADGRHYVLTAGTMNRRSVPILIQGTGWLPLTKLADDLGLPTGKDDRGRTMVFQSSLDGVPDEISGMIFTQRDRKKLVAAILNTTLGPIPNGEFKPWIALRPKTRAEATVRQSTSQSIDIDLG